jgi:phage gp36-like protein
MAWQAISTDDIKTRLTGSEVSSLQTAALASGQSDPLPEIVTQVVDEIRGYIAAGGFTLEEGEKLPSKLVSAALAIIRYRIATRLPVKSFLDENRVRENESALRLLERVADGKFAIEEPVTAEDEAVGSSSPSLTSKTRYFKNSDQDGI